MLSLALAATLVGFGLLVAALMMSNLPLAIACVVICVVGLVLLVVDTLRAGRRGRAGEDDEPLFTIRGRESASREEPLEADSDDQAVAAPAAGRSNDETKDEVAGGTPAYGGQTAYGDQTASTWSLGDGHGSSGLGDLVAPTAQHVVDGEMESGSGGFATQSGGFATQSGGFAAADASAGDVNDYLRSTGSFPVQQSAAPAEPAPEQSAVSEAPAPAVDPHTAAPQAADPETAAPETAAPQAAEPEAAQPDRSEPYVGRRRLAGDPTDNIVVRSASPDLPAMQFRWDDPDAEPKGDAPG